MENKNGIYRVTLEIWKEYVNPRRNNKQDHSVKFSKEKKEALIDWIDKWKRIKDLDFSLETKHFFLDGRHLDELSKELISRAESEVLVVNPFVSKCALSDTLKETSNSGTNVKLITRPPEDKNPEYRRNKKEYHLNLEEMGVTIRYNKQVHAKIIAVDRAVAILSSMNFYCGSSGGASWEAGIISLEETVVEPIVNSILKIFERPETKNIEEHQIDAPDFNDAKEISTF